ncbi:MAG TPA: hypothetical protein VFI72_04895 [Candidatus Angelobacter sp.]|nr:hypothetical protein [Candidatus Angelobacter sp.]
MDENFSKAQLWVRFALAGLGLLVLLGFVAFVLARHTIDAGKTPQVGQMAPDFSLPDDHGKAVPFSELIANPLTTSSRVHSTKAVLIVFYRGYW